MVLTVGYEGSGVLCHEVQKAHKTPCQEGEQAEPGGARGTGTESGTSCLKWVKRVCSCHSCVPVSKQHHLVGLLKKSDEKVPVHWPVATVNWRLVSAHWDLSCCP